MLYDQELLTFGDMRNTMGHLVQSLVLHGLLIPFHCLRVIVDGSAVIVILTIASNLIRTYLLIYIKSTKYVTR